MAKTKYTEEFTLEPIYAGDSPTRIMSQNATKTYMEDNLRDIQTILDEINRGSL